MTYKSAAAGLDLGGGKAVIIGDPATDKTEALIRAYGRFVDALGGRYITAEDVGTTQADMDLIRRETRHVTGVCRSLGGSGDPSRGHRLRRAARDEGGGRRLWGDDRPRGSPRASSAASARWARTWSRHLVEERARVTVADVDAGRSRRASTADFGVETVAGREDPRDRMRHLLAVRARRVARTPSTIPELRCAAVVGSANNQLAATDVRPAAGARPVCSTRPTSSSTPAA